MMFTFVSSTLVGLLLLTIESSNVLPLGLGSGGPDLLACLVVHLGLNRELGEAVLPLLLLGYLADVFAASPAGTHLASLVVVFLLLQLLRSRLSLHGLAVSTMLSGVAALTTSVLLWVLASIFISDFQSNPALLRFAVVRGVLTIPFAVPLLRLLLRIERLDPAST